MNIQETLALIEALKSAGATHFKSSGCELTLSAGSVSLPVEKMPQPSAPVQQNGDATEKLKGLIDTLKMDDGQLLDKIFPAGAGG